jgi:hypothetical protein
LRVKYADRLRSLDQACIEQTNPAASLPCLPIYLAGCKRLVVLAGPTFTERLWTAVELFTFTVMGGTLDRIDVLPLDRRRGLAGVLDKFDAFDVTHAKCARTEDRQRLLAVIEAAFGNHGPFNLLVRTILRRRHSRRHGSTRGGGRPALSSRLSAAGLGLLWGGGGSPAVTARESTVSSIRPSDAKEGRGDGAGEESKRDEPDKEEDRGGGGLGGEQSGAAARGATTTSGAGGADVVVVRMSACVV